MRFPLIANAFPDFPIAELPSFVQLFMEDQSYQHDEVPSFRRGTTVVYVNRMRPEDREPGAPRFNVAHEADEDQELVFIYTGDDEAQAFRALQAFEDVEVVDA
jgi:hypothetical protein